jgi:serine/threonine protein kinase
MQPQPQPSLLEKLNRCLERFRAVRITDITDHYQYYPSLPLSRLGEGSYGAAYRMKSTTNDKEPLRVVKVIPKDRVSKHLLQIQHLASELAVSMVIRHANINHRVGLFHNDTTIFIPMELVEGKEPDLATRLYFLFAKYGSKSRIAEVPQLVEECPRGGEDLLIANELRRLGLTKEDPRSGDLFNHIVHYKRIPTKKALVIIKQALEGLQFFHDNAVVHRDVKTENLVLGEDRKATPIYATEQYEGEDGQPATRQKIIGVRLEERITVRVIDFGLVKYLHLGSQFPSSPSPSNFGSAASADPFGSAPAMGAGSGVPAVPATAPLGGGGNLFSVIAVTPCGTELYCSLEVIQGIIRGGYGRSKWTSDAHALRKFDVYGAGTMLFCMCNGRPPFRLNAYRQVSREEKLRQMSNMIAAGPQFSANCPESVRPLIRKLMNNDVNLRPTSTEALQDPTLAGLNKKYIYEVMLDGTVTELDAAATGGDDEGHSTGEERSNTTNTTTTGGASSGTGESAHETTATGAEDDELGQEVDALDLRDVMRFVRGKEDNGDDADKADDDEAVEPAAAAV